MFTLLKELSTGRAHLLVLRILFVSSHRTCGTCAPPSGRLPFSTSCVRPFPLLTPERFVIHVHLRGLLSCRRGTFVHGAILLFGSFRSHICDSYESGDQVPRGHRAPLGQFRILNDFRGVAESFLSSHDKPWCWSCKHLSLQVPCDNC